MSEYMDYPFLCDEKTGERCLAQCAACKAADVKRMKEWAERKPDGLDNQDKTR